MERFFWFFEYEFWIFDSGFRREGEFEPFRHFPWTRPCPNTKPFLIIGLGNFQLTGSPFPIWVRMGNITLSPGIVESGKKIGLALGMLMLHGQAKLFLLNCRLPGSALPTWPLMGFTYKRMPHWFSYIVCKFLIMRFSLTLINDQFQMI